MKTVERAFKHVKAFFPNLSILVLNKEGQWCYMDENFEAFNFEGIEIDQSILEDVADNIEVLPFIYQE